MTKKISAKKIKNSFSSPVLDILFSSLVVAPTVIGYWRGTWCLSDVYIFPKNLCVDLVVSGVVGTIIQIAFTLVQDFFQENIRPDKHKVFYHLISRGYTYVYGLACVNMWRGGWKALDYYSGTDPVRVVVPTLVSFFVVACLKTMRTLPSVPFLVSVDNQNNYFQVPTMFKLTKNGELPLYILDCFFSVFVIGSLVVFIWRGVWCLTDIFLFPENEKYSALSSLAIGYIIVIIIFGIQNSMEHISEKLTGFWRLFVADIYVFVSFIGTINLWRGMWNLLNLYFLPEFPIWSYWITHLGCFAFLVFIKCSNTILVRGVYLDGEDGGKCIVFPTFYFTLFFQKFKNDKSKENQANEEKKCSDENSKNATKGKENEKITNVGDDSSTAINVSA